MCSIVKGPGSEELIDFLFKNAKYLIFKGDLCYF
jgi:hypothetical protein